MKTAKLVTAWRVLMRSWLGSIVIALLIATSFKAAVADWYVVPTGSMKPTIVEGDRIVVNKLAYDLKVPYTRWHLAQWGAPQRGDVVVFQSPVENIRLVKRVIGMPGDTVELRADHLIINGQEAEYQRMTSLPDLEDQPLMAAVKAFGFREQLADQAHPVLFVPIAAGVHNFGPLVIPPGRYFMMGDNRNNSADSRFFGLVSRELILGRAKVVAISLDSQHHYRPRWKRFFTALL